MGLIPLANRLYSTYSTINEFLDRWILPLLVKLISEYEEDSAILQQRANHKTDMPTDMAPLTGKQQTCGSQPSEVKK